MLSSSFWSRSVSTFALALGLASSTRAMQQTMSPVWGGECRHAYTWIDPSNSSHLRTFVCEDGGRIRYMDSGTGTWSYLPRPSHTPPLQSMLGVFSPDGSNVYAVGQNGKFMSASTPTGTWTLASTVYEDPATQTTPSRLWGVRYFSSTGIGFLSGVHVLRSTQNGSVPATEPVFVNPGYSVGNLEFYGLSTVGTSSSFQAVVCVDGSIVDSSGNPVLHNGDEQGVGAFWTSSDAADKDASNHYKWHEASFTFLNNEPLDEEFEPWDVAFAPGASASTAVGYMVGGVGNTLYGRVFKTCNGGKNWVEETINDLPAHTLYGVHVFADGSAIAVGYGGQIYTRQADDPAHPCRNFGWDLVQPVAGDPLHCDTSYDFTGPITGVSGNAGSGSSGTAYAVGTFGYLFKTTDKGASWSQEASNGGTEWRLSSVAFQDSSVGWMAGQAAIARTSNGGAVFDSEECHYGALGTPSLAFSSSGHGIAVAVHTSRNAVLHRPPNSGMGSWNDIAPTSGSDNDQLMDVQWAENETFFAVGNLTSSTTPVLLRITITGSSPTYTVTRTALTAPSGSLTLTNLALFNGNMIFVVGTNGTNGKAYRATFTGGYTSGTLGSWVDVSPSTASVAGTRLNAIDAAGTLSAPEVYAVGDGGVALRWNRTADKLECLSNVYVTSACGTPFALTTQDLFAVTIAADSGSNSVFIGGNFGTLIRRKSGTWALFDSDTSKNLYGFSFPASSPLYGFAIGQSDPNLSGTDIGIIADSIILKYQ